MGTSPDEVREFTPILITRPILKKTKAAATETEADQPNPNDGLASRWNRSVLRWRNFHKWRGSWADCYTKIGKETSTNSRILHITTYRPLSLTFRRSSLTCFTYGFNMELNLKFNPFYYVAVREQAIMRKESLEFAKQQSLKVAVGVGMFA